MTRLGVRLGVTRTVLVLVVGVSVSVAGVGVGAASASPRSSPRITITSEAHGLAAAASMTKAAKSLYLSTTPTIDDHETFAKHCPIPDRAAPAVSAAARGPGDGPAVMILLGCYNSRPHRIHLLRLDRAELTSGMTVAAAHETLHAAYEALDGDERAKFDTQAKAALAAQVDGSLRAIIDAYPKRERASELHSRLGTEVTSLPPALNRYYAKYFRDRSTVVAAHDRYASVFRDLETRVTDLRAQIDALRAQLADVRVQIEAHRAEATRLGSEIDGLRSQGRIGESNQLIGAQNGEASATNALIEQHNALFDQTNALVDAYNALALTSRELLESLEPIAHAA